MQNKIITKVFDNGFDSLTIDEAKIYIGLIGDKLAETPVRKYYLDFKILSKYYKEIRASYNKMLEKASIIIEIGFDSFYINRIPISIDELKLIALSESGLVLELTDGTVISNEVVKRLYEILLICRI